MLRCSQCPDFDLCARLGGSRRCVRRTIASDPCPELCDEGEGDGLLRGRRERIEKKKRELAELAADGIVEAVGSCRCGHDVMRY